MEGLTLWDILRSIGLMVFVYIALTKLSVYVREREIRTFKEGKATGRYNFFWRRAIRRMKRGDFAPPKSFKPVHLPGHSVTNLAMVAAPLLRKHADGEPMLDDEVELLKKVDRYKLYDPPGELPEYIKAGRRTLADIKLALVVMQRYSHLLKEDREYGEKELPDWEKEFRDDFLPEMVKGLQKTDWEKELKEDRKYWEKKLKEEQTSVLN